MAIEDSGTETKLATNTTLESQIGVPINQIVDGIRKGEPNRASYHTERIKKLLEEQTVDQVAETLGQEIADLEEQRDEDPATHIKTRISGMKLLKHHIAVARSEGHPLSVMMLDLDGFKRINDTQGHEAGNKVIEMLAGFLNNETSSEVVACRYGGDEFFAIMPGSSIDEAQGLAKRVSKELQPKMLENGYNVTASIGISALTGDETPDDLIGRADSGVLEAKELGKNQFVVK